MAIISRRLDSGPNNVPWNSSAEAVEGVGGIEEEYLFEGTALQYELADRSSSYPTDGRWSAVPMAREPFRSRMLVVRPRDPAAFNGTVIVTWNNVSQGQDMFGVAPEMINDGFAVVGVTTQRAGVEGYPFREPEDGSDYVPLGVGLKDRDAERYGSLEHPGDGFSYDIFTRAAELLSPTRSGAIDPLGGLDVRHLVASGASQSANRLATYINAVQPITSTFDAFFLMVYAGCPCALDPATAPTSLPQIPTNIVELLPWRTFQLREDLRVPIIVLNSETEAEQCHPNSQPDTDFLRWWEVAGTSHVGLMPPEGMAMVSSVLPDACLVSFQPAARAATEALRRWLDVGEPPSHQPRLLKAGDPPALARDEYGNAIDGIRWPDIEAPLATLVGESPPDGFTQLMGKSTPFSSEELRFLYADHTAWLTKYEEATQRLVESGVVLPDDAKQMIARAAALEVPL